MEDATWSDSPQDAAEAARAEQGSVQARDALRAAYERAAAQCPDAVGTAFFSLAGQVVRISTVGAQLGVCATAAFAHLRIDAPRTPPRLSVDLWAECETGVGRPPTDPRLSLGVAWTRGTSAAASAPSGNLVRLQRLRHLDWLERASGSIVGWRFCGTLPTYEQIKPLPVLLPIWCADQDLQLIHAGMVVRNGAGALIAGRSRAGKSTTALACLHFGLQLDGDDTVALEERSDGELIGHSLFATAQLDPRHLADLPAYRAVARLNDHPGEPRLFIPLAEVFPERLVRAAPIRALIFPVVEGANRLAIRPLSSGDAFRRLAASSLWQTIAPTRAEVSRLSRLAQRVPAYHLALSDDLHSVVDAVDTVIARATLPQPR